MLSSNIIRYVKLSLTIKNVHAWVEEWKVASEHLQDVTQAKANG